MLWFRVKIARLQKPREIVQSILRMYSNFRDISSTETQAASKLSCLTTKNGTVISGSIALFKPLIGSSSCEEDK